MNKELRNKYRGNSNALKILDSLEFASKNHAELPISFYISDCDEDLLKQILLDYGFSNPKIERKPIGRDTFGIMVRPRG